MAAACKVCKEKERVITALELANQVLLEMVNLQRAIPAAAPQAVPQGPEIKEYPPLTPVDGTGDDDIDEALARLNDPGTSEEDAERLLSQLQAFNTRVERAD